MDGKERTLLVHRKGSTRAFPPHHPLIAVDYQVSLAVGERNQKRILDESGNFRVPNRDLNAVSSIFELTALEPRWDGNVLLVCVLDPWDTELSSVPHPQWLEDHEGKGVFRS